MNHDVEDFRSFARALFGEAGTQSVAEPDERSNRSPAEGTTPTSADPDQPMRDFVRDLFTPID